jgi:hypothetical protein
MLFTTAHIGRTDNTAMLRTFSRATTDLPALQKIILLSGSLDDLAEYQNVIQTGSGLPAERLAAAQAAVSPYDTCNLQFTSG